MISSFCGPYWGSFMLQWNPILIFFGLVPMPQNLSWDGALELHSLTILTFQLWIRKFTQEWSSPWERGTPFFHRKRNGQRMVQVPWHTWPWSWLVCWAILCAVLGRSCWALHQWSLVETRGWRFVGKKNEDWKERKTLIIKPGFHIYVSFLIKTKKEWRFDVLPVEIPQVSTLQLLYVTLLGCYNRSNLKEKPSISNSIHVQRIYFSVPFDFSRFSQSISSV